jgi:hypothetical protein
MEKVASSQRCFARALATCMLLDCEETYPATSDRLVALVLYDCAGRSSFGFGVVDYSS